MKKKFTVNHNGSIFDVVISRGISRDPNAPFMVFKVKDNGSLMRLRWIPKCKTVEEAEKIFHERRGKHEYLLKSEVDEYLKSFIHEIGEV